MSPGFFSVFWPILIMMLFGLSSLILFIPSPPVCRNQSFDDFTEHTDYNWYHSDVHVSWIFIPYSNYYYHYCCFSALLLVSYNPSPSFNQVHAWKKIDATSIFPGVNFFKHIRITPNDDQQFRKTIIRTSSCCSKSSSGSYEGYW